MISFAPKFIIFINLIIIGNILMSFCYNNFDSLLFFLNILENLQPLKLNSN